ncbi:MAG TPA: alpha/beta fold hydrolase [Patescibacteria group bacterium]|nr:alpha/beta fold hydrolase [Patescibacteria group bacterium]
MTDSPWEPRFLEPEGWRWDYFTNAQGARLRFGYIDPANSNGIVVALPGLSEFGEKYFEVARDMLARNLSFFVIDWRGQGKSDRYLPNPHRRHSAGFGSDVADLQQMLAQHVIPRAGRRPLFMLAHSMGGHIGLRHLSEHAGIFACAAFSAPMLGILGTKVIPTALRVPVTATLATLMGTNYVFGGGDWHPGFRDRQARAVLSGDPPRRAVHNGWCLRDPQLQVGNVTYGWLHEAMVSCATLNGSGIPESIRTPCLIGVAGRDMLVDNKATRAFAKRLPYAQVLELEGAFHEILMERDEFRSRFLAAFDALRAEAVENSSKQRQTRP